MVDSLSLHLQQPLHNLALVDAKTRHVVRPGRRQVAERGELAAAQENLAAATDVAGRRREAVSLMFELFVWADLRRILSDEQYQKAVTEGAELTLNEAANLATAPIEPMVVTSDIGEDPGRIAAE